MNELNKVVISESEYYTEIGNAKLTIFTYTGSANPKDVLDLAVSIYTQNNSYHEFIDASLDNPWVRVIMSDINGMKQKKFNKDSDRM